MLLNNKYFRVLNEDKTSENSAVYRCALLADCDVYRGHFPHKPVSPGVCNIEMIKECAMMLLGNENLKISTIKQCRLTAVASPQVCPEVEVAVEVSPNGDGITVVASIKGTEVQEDGTQTDYMTFKGDLV